MAKVINESTTKCKKCGRTIKSPTSILRHMGSTCYKNNYKKKQQKFNFDIMQSKSIKQALEKLKHFNFNKNLFIGECIRFVPKIGIEVNNLLEEVTIHFDYNGPEFIVNYKTINKLFKNDKTNEVTFKVEGQKLKVITDKFTHFLDIENLTDWPKTKINEKHDWSKKMVLSENDIRNINNIKEFTSHDVLFPDLNYVYFGYDTVATDRSIMAVIPNKIPGNERMKRNRIKYQLIPYSLINLLLNNGNFDIYHSEIKNLPNNFEQLIINRLNKFHLENDYKDEQDKIEHSQMIREELQYDDIFIIKNANMTIVYSYDMDFPNYSQVIPKNYKITFSIERNVLQTFLKVMQIHNSTALLFDIFHTKNEIILKGTETFDSTVKIQKNISVEIQSGIIMHAHTEIKFRCSLLEIILKATSNEKLVNFKMNDSSKIVCINDNYFLMPLQI